MFIFLSYLYSHIFENIKKLIPINNYETIQFKTVENNVNRDMIIQFKNKTKNTNCVVTL